MLLIGKPDSTQLYSCQCDLYKAVNPHPKVKGIPSVAIQKPQTTESNVKL